MILYSCMLAKIQEKEKIQEKGLLKIIPEILCFIDLTNTINSNTLSTFSSCVPFFNLTILRAFLFVDKCKKVY